MHYYEAKRIQHYFNEISSRHFFLILHDGYKIYFLTHSLYIPTFFYSLNVTFFVTLTLMKMPNAKNDDVK